MYKRPFDLIILTSSHIFLFPLLLLLWTVIPLIIWSSDRGSIFYIQIRTGEKGKKFKVRKFRIISESKAGKFYFFTLITLSKHIPETTLLFSLF